jgi:hypothetical protein
MLNLNLKKMNAITKEWQCDSCQYYNPEDNSGCHSAHSRWDDNQRPCENPFETFNDIIDDVIMEEVGEQRNYTHTHNRVYFNNHSKFITVIAIHINSDGKFRFIGKTGHRVITPEEECLIPESLLIEPYWEDFEV